MRILDTGHAFFRPLWVRLGIVFFAFAWAALEVSLGEIAWALVFGCIASYCAWTLLLGYREPPAGDGKDG